MYVSKNIVYTELHKTGGTHIDKWLERILVGKQIGKHNRIPKKFQNRFVIGSIRNPWDWYVSLWAYGCAHKGSVAKLTTKQFDFGYLSKQLHSEMGGRRTSLLRSGRQLWHWIFKPVEKWKRVYNDFTEAEAFRKWLLLMFDSNRRFDFGEGYGFSPVSEKNGLLTYRFLKLYSSLSSELYWNMDLSVPKNLKGIWNKYTIVDYMVRMESLEFDLIEAFERAGLQIDPSMKEEFASAQQSKTNTSNRLPASYYYDEETIKLVAAHESLIVDLFDYKPPEINSGDGVVL